MQVLLIGMGMVAQTHILALRDNRAGLRLDAVLGRDANRTQQFCDQASSVLGYDVAPLTDLSVALGRRPDMALLITPPDARMDFATALSDAGVPTLMEKPVERSLSRARALVDVYAERNVTLGLCFQHRTRASARALRDRLCSGVLGDVVHVDIRVPWWRDQAYYDAPGRGTYARDGGGVMINQAIHTLDLALSLVGPVARVQSTMRTSPVHQMEAEDIAVALLAFQSGASGILSATTTAYPGDTESIALITTRGTATLRGDHLKIQLTDGTHDTVEPVAGSGTGGGVNPMAFTHGWHQTVLEDFADAIATTRAPIAPADEALHVHAVIDAMERAAHSHTQEDVAT